MTVAVKSMEPHPTPSFYAAQQVTEQYCQLVTKPEYIAHTRHSRVFRAFSSLYGQFVAIKLIDKTSIPVQLVEKFLPRELDITQKVNHPNVVRSLFVGVPHPTKVVIISEFMDGGTLLKNVIDAGGLSEPKTANLFGQLIEGVNYLHESLGVVHRDIKLENILLDSKGVLKLVDFGFSRAVTRAEKSTSYCGTRPYSAPQLVDHVPYNPFSADWFACGIALYTMIAGSWPYLPTEKISYPIYNHSKISVLAKTLIDHLLMADETHRAGYLDCKFSPWLQSMLSIQRPHPVFQFPQPPVASQAQHQYHFPQNLHHQQQQVPQVPAVNVHQNQYNPIQGPHVYPQTQHPQMHTQIFVNPLQQHHQQLLESVYFTQGYVN